MALASCNPVEEASDAQCAVHETFDVKSRSCIPSYVPNPGLGTVSIVEDSGGQTINLPYTYVGNNYATGCNVVDYTKSLGCLKVGLPNDITGIYELPATCDVVAPYIPTCSCSNGVCTAFVTPSTNFSGAAGITYVLNNSEGVSEEFVQVIQVTPVDDPPFPRPQPFPVFLDEDIPGTITLYYDDYDDGWSASSCTTTMDSNLQVITPCACSFGVCTVTIQNATSDWNGSASFTYDVTVNGRNFATPYTVDVTVNPAEDAPVATLTSGSMVEDTEKVFTFELNNGYTDADYPDDGKVATSCTVSNLVNVEEVATGVCDCNIAGVCTVTIKGITDFNTTRGDAASFDYQVTVNNVTSAAQTVTLTIDAVNDQPTIAGLTDYIGANAGNEDETLTITGITVDEGGSQWEDYQDLIIRITTDNALVLPSSNIVVKYDGVDLNYNGNDPVTIPTTAGADASLKQLSLELTPVATMSNNGAPITVSITVSDNVTEGNSPTIPSILPDLSVTDTFQVEFIEVDDPPYMTYKGGDIPDTGTNEAGTVRFNELVFDEGGGPGEDGQKLYVYIHSSNLPLVPHSNIVFNFPVGTLPPQLSPFTIAGCDSGNNCSGSGSPLGVVTPDHENVIYQDTSQTDSCYRSTGVNDTDWVAMTCPLKFSLGDDANDASTLGQGMLQLTPVGTESGTTTISIFVQDEANGGGAPISISYYTFVLTVYPVGAIHGGWENLMAIGPRYGADGNILTDIDTGEDIRGYIKLHWKDFIMAGTGTEYSNATINGWHVYRRAHGDDYDFDNPINGASTPLTFDTRSYVDTYNSTTNADLIAEDDDKGKVFFYTVRPLDSKNNIPTVTKESFSEVRMVLPPKNMVMVHRWIANREVCEKMHQQEFIDGRKNFRCPYRGPGEVLDTSDNLYYYDIQADLLVDLVEAGCPYTDPVTAGTDCGPDGCIGLLPPSQDDYAKLATTADLVYYDRGSGTCYRSHSPSPVQWAPFQDLNDDNAHRVEFVDYSRRTNLPPLSNVLQQDAFDFCVARTDIVIPDISGSGQASFTLPSRKQQIAYSAWDSGYSDSNISTLEGGLAINSSPKCNSNSANGIESFYTDASIPLGAFKASLPGTYSSGIRSVITGSDVTSDCISRFGVQDHVGNVAEWVRDQMECTETYYCNGRDSDLDTSNFNDMAVSDGQFGYFSSADGSGGFVGVYGMRGNVGPCNDSDGSGGACIEGDGSMESWSFFDDSTYNAGRFSFPLGLPIHKNYSSSFFIDIDVLGNYTSPHYTLEIGPSSGITAAQLHNDYMGVNSDDIEREANQRAALSVGGSYKDGEKAGRYAINLLPKNEVAPRYAWGIVQQIRYDAVIPGVTGNRLRILYAECGVDTNGDNISDTNSNPVCDAGNEEVVVQAFDVTVYIEHGVSSTTNVVNAVNNDIQAQLIVSATPIGSDDPDSTPVYIDMANLTGGVDGVAKYETLYDNNSPTQGVTNHTVRSLITSTFVLSLIKQANVTQADYPTLYAKLGNNPRAGDIETIGNRVFMVIDDVGTDPTTFRNYLENSTKDDNLFDFKASGADTIGEQDIIMTPATVGANPSMAVQNVLFTVLTSDRLMVVFLPHAQEAGNEQVVVEDLNYSGVDYKVIRVYMENGITTASQIAAAVNADEDAPSYVFASVSGGDNPQYTSGSAFRGGKDPTQASATVGISGNVTITLSESIFAAVAGYQQHYIGTAGNNISITFTNHQIDISSTSPHAACQDQALPPPHFDDIDNACHAAYGAGTDATMTNPAVPLNFVPPGWNGTSLSMEYHYDQDGNSQTNVDVVSAFRTHISTAGAGIPDVRNVSEVFAIDVPSDKMGDPAEVGFATTAGGVDAVGATLTKQSLTYSFTNNPLENYYSTIRGANANGITITYNPVDSINGYTLIDAAGNGIEIVVGPNNIDIIVNINVDGSDLASEVITAMNAVVLPDGIANCDATVAGCVLTSTNTGIGDPGQIADMDILPLATEAELAYTDIGDIRYYAYYSGEAGNDIKIIYEDSTSLSVSDTGPDEVTIRFIEGVTTAGQIMEAVYLNSLLVVPTLRPPIDIDGDGFFTSDNETADINNPQWIISVRTLTGGLDSINTNSSHGFRCLVPLDPASFKDDPYHTYPY